MSISAHVIRSAFQDDQQHKPVQSFTFDELFWNYKIRDWYQLLASNTLSRRFCLPLTSYELQVRTFIYYIAEQWDKFCRVGRLLSHQYRRSVRGVSSANIVSVTFLRSHRKKKTPHYLSQTAAKFLGQTVTHTWGLTLENPLKRFCIVSGRPRHLLLEKVWFHHKTS